MYTVVLQLYTNMGIHIRKLLWEKSNQNHIRRHNVNREEVEEVILSNPQADKAYKRARVSLIGETVTGRVLKIILQHKGKDIYYPVTAHDADEREIVMYKRRRGGEKS